MRQLTRSIAAVVAVASAIVPGQLVLAQTSTVPANLVLDVQRSERFGKALFQAYDQPVADTPLIERTRAVAEGALVERCDGPYRTFVLASDSQPPSSILVYLLADLPPSAGIVGGRHFRIEVSTDGAEILSVSPSTKGCLLIPAPPADMPDGSQPVAASMSHILAATPSEFHVFLSLRHKKTIYVGTSAGVWKVDAGRVSYVGARP